MNHLKSDQILKKIYIDDQKRFQNKTTKHLLESSNNDSLVRSNKYLYKSNNLLL